MIIKNLLYIYQLEHYDKKRFLRFAYQNLNWFTLQKRSTLDWTKRIGFIFAVLIALVTLPAFIIHFLTETAVLLFFLVSCIVLLPVLIVAADSIITPLITVQKNNLIRTARQIIRNNKKRNMVTVGITGSFGKTTVKQLLIDILSEKYTVFSFPGNINTDIGVAKYCIDNAEKMQKADVLIAEMGAYRKGDIKKLCAVVEPDYSITTAIGECHLERFGSLENIIEAKFELANATKKKAFLNTDNETIKNNMAANIGNRAGITEVRGSESIQELKPIKNFEGISFTYREKPFTTKIVAPYIADLAVLAFALAEELKVSLEQMQNGLKKVDYIPHRLEIMRNDATKITIIDDSYNGNYDGFMAGLDILKQAKGRKVVLTPGLTELGEERSKERHSDLANEYAKSVDLLLLVKNRNTEYLLKTLRRVGYTTLKVYDTTQEAHADLKTVLEEGDTILFQNDIPDNYA